MPATPGVRPSRRIDARRNRGRLLESARAVMREQGLDASLGEIARRAGVGNATLYRHFPTREALCEAVFAEYGADLERLRERVLRIPDPWDALTTWFEETCATFADDRAFAELLTQGMPRSPALTAVCESAIALAGTLLDRARSDGAVRPDVELTDVLLLVYSLQRIVPAVSQVAPGAWRRHLTLALDGLRPRPGAPLPAAALSFDQLVRFDDRVLPATRREPVAAPAPEPEPEPARVPAAAISDELWELIEPAMPSSTGRRGRPWRDHRQALEAILWRYRTGCPWRDLPAEFGPWQTLWRRHHRWTAEGVYQRIVERLVQS